MIHKMYEFIMHTHTHTHYGLLPLFLQGAMIMITVMK